MGKTQINYRKNIVRELYSEKSHLKYLKNKFKCWNYGDVELLERLTIQTEAKIELLENLLKPYRK